MVNVLYGLGGDCKFLRVSFNFIIIHHFCRLEIKHSLIYTGIIGFKPYLCNQYIEEHETDFFSISFPRKIYMQKASNGALLCSSSGLPFFKLRLGLPIDMVKLYAIENE